MHFGSYLYSRSSVFFDIEKSFEILVTFFIRCVIVSSILSRGISIIFFGIKQPHRFRLVFNCKERRIFCKCIKIYDFVIRMARRKGLTMNELNSLIDNWSDSEDEIDSVVILPPDRVDDITDEETIDDDIIPINDQVIFSLNFVENMIVQTWFDII